MDILDMGVAFKESIIRLRTFAEQQTNWYYPGLSGFVPGDVAPYVAHWGTLRVVFTWTVDDQIGVVRHLTVSTVMQRPGRPTHPNAMLVFTIASLLGFTGATMSGGIAVAHNPAWHMALSDPEDRIPHVILGEKVPENELPKVVAN